MKAPLTHSAFGPRLLWRFGGAAVIASMTLPMLGCGSNQSASIPPPVQDAPGTVPQSQMAPQANTNQGMSTGTKLKILAGAAAAYYLYKKYKSSQEAKAVGQNVQYYVSKSTGRVYYRDPKTHQAHFVTPPTNQIQQVQVPANQAQEYSRFQGYENQNTGQTLANSGLFTVQ